MGCGKKVMTERGKRGHNEQLEVIGSFTNTLLVCLLIENKGSLYLNDLHDMRSYNLQTLLTIILNNNVPVNHTCSVSNYGVLWEPDKVN